MAADPTGTTDHLDWNPLLRDQLSWHWTHQLRARLAGLTDEEYFWEPVPGCWNVRPRDATAGSGPMTIDFAMPEPDPPPLTTIAWRLGHVIVGVLAMRSAAHFGAPPTDYGSFPYAATAAGALAQLDAEYATWQEGVASLGEEGLARPCGANEAYPELPMGALVLHINRETIHHLSEVCLLRDLHLHTHRKADRHGA